MKEIDGSLDGCAFIISDGMKATLKIGLRYLWADKYCINQNNPGDKHKQIRQMDKINENSKVTIIAATSVSVDGLPGVGRIKRSSQTCLQVGGLVLGRTLRRPRSIVGSSKWSTRGWTFQEGLLSRRRLIFTDEQVIFECNGMHCVESMTLPLDEIHDHETNIFKGTLPSGWFRRKSLGSDLQDFMTYVSDFSERELRFLGDRLNAMNAMRGIFHKFETAPFPVHQLMGVPVLLPWVYHQIERDKPQVFTRVNRTPEQGFLVGLTWSHYSNFATGTRIPQFPSWSWAGWTRRVDYMLKFSDWWTTTLNETPVWMEGDSGELKEFPTLDQLRDLKPNDTLGRQIFILIEGNTFACSTVQLRREELPERERFGVDAGPGTPGYVQVAGENGWSFFFSVSWDRTLETNEQSGKQLTGILIGDLDNDPWDHIAIIFVEELDRHAQRIGVGNDISAIYKGWKADKTDGMRYQWLHFAKQETQKLEEGED